MPTRLSTLIRMVLACALGLGVLTLRLPGRVSHQAWARAAGGDDDDWGDEGGDGDSDSDHDRDRSGDQDSGDQDDSDDEDDGEGDGSGMDKDQPPVTAGGLYTKKTFPTALTLRPLTLIKGMFEVLGGFNMDMSALDAFETWRVPIEARYGLADHVELQTGVDFLLVSNQLRRDTTDDAIINLGLEGALYYDLVDIRVAANIGVNADAPEAPPGVDSQSFNQPFWMDLVMGFPFRWAPKKQFAIVGLDKIFTVHLRGAKPDLTATLGVIVQPIDFLALLLQAELTVPQFNTNTLLVPASATLQFSPSNSLDLGLRFTFKNVKPPEGSDLGPFDERFLLVFLQTRL